MSTTQVLGPYESRSIYRELHSGPTGVDWMAFVAACNERPRHPHERDGAARAALLPPEVVAARDAQPAPSPLSVDGGAR